jgi:dihydropyrimidinase
MNADTWESATVLAAYGGTTTVLAFAARHVGMELPTVSDQRLAGNCPAPRRDSRQ